MVAVRDLAGRVLVNWAVKCLGRLMKDRSRDCCRIDIQAKAGSNRGKFAIDGSLEANANSLAVIVSSLGLIAGSLDRDFVAIGTHCSKSENAR